MDAKSLMNAVELGGWTKTAADIDAGIKLRESFREALEEIADQKTSEEIEADHKALLDDFGAHDFEVGYDTAIRRARAALGRSNPKLGSGQ
jgi:hypothetical protein